MPINLSEVLFAFKKSTKSFRFLLVQQTIYSYKYGGWKESSSKKKGLLVKDYLLARVEKELQILMYSEYEMDLIPENIWEKKKNGIEYLKVRKIIIYFLRRFVCLQSQYKIKIVCSFIGKKSPHRNWNVHVL